METMLVSTLSMPPRVRQGLLVRHLEHLTVGGQDGILSQQQDLDGMPVHLEFFGGLQLLMVMSFGSAP
jgi:hypothetical protein